jgi:hypothetical protein
MSASPCNQNASFSSSSVCSISVTILLPSASAFDASVRILLIVVWRWSVFRTTPSIPPALELLHLVPTRSRERYSEWRLDESRTPSWSVASPATLGCESFGDVSSCCATAGRRTSHRSPRVALCHLVPLEGGPPATAPVFGGASISMPGLAPASGISGGVFSCAAPESSATVLPACSRGASPRLDTEKELLLETAHKEIMQKKEKKEKRKPTCRDAKAPNPLHVFVSFRVAVFFLRIPTMVSIFHHQERRTRPRPTHVPTHETHTHTHTHYTTDTHTHTHSV